MRRRIVAIVVVCIALPFMASGSMSASPFPETITQEKSLEEQLEQARQTTSVANIMTLGYAVEYYIMEHLKFGAPKVGSLKELVSVLKDTDSFLRKEPILEDGWGRSFAYEVDQTPGSKSYHLMSFGADGKPGPESYVPSIIKFFDEDIIYSDGSFIQRPMGKQYLQSVRDTGIPTELIKLRANAYEAAKHTERQMITVGILRDYGLRLHKYILYNEDIGAPKVSTVEELVAVLKAFDSESRLPPTRDAWGNSFLYITKNTKGDPSYILISYGADGKPEPIAEKGTLLIDENEDIIFANGRIASRPVYIELEALEKKNFRKPIK